MIKSFYSGSALSCNVTGKDKKADAHFHLGIRNENINIALRFYVMKTQLHVHHIMFFVSKYGLIWFPKSLSCCFGNFDLNQQTWRTLIGFSFSWKLVTLYKIVALCELHIHLNISKTPRYSWMFWDKNNNPKKVDLVASEKSLVSLSTIENYMSVTLKSYNIWLNVTAVLDPSLNSLCHD